MACSIIHNRRTKKVCKHKHVLCLLIRSSHLIPLYYLVIYYGIDIEVIESSIRMIFSVRNRGKVHASDKKLVKHHSRHGIQSLSYARYRYQGNSTVRQKLLTVFIFIDILAKKSVQFSDVLRFLWTIWL